MKSGGDIRSEKGFTVIETLIVLAVTSALFILTVVFMNGRQSKTEFQTGSRNIAQQIQQVINETQSGYYPHQRNFSCSAAGAGPNVTITSGGVNLGENGDCVFAGRTLVFNPSTKDTYAVYTLAARRAYLSPTGETKDVDKPSSAWITAVDPYATDTQKNPGGLEYYGGRVSQASPPPWNAATRFPVTFLSGFANFGSINDTGGSQRIELRSNTSPAWAIPSNTDVYSINQEAAQPNPYGVDPSQGVDLCFNSAGTDQSVAVNISDGLVAGFSIKAGRNCP